MARRRRDLSLVVKGILFALVRVDSLEAFLERVLLAALRNNFGGPHSARSIEEAGALAFVTPLVISEEGLWCQSKAECQAGIATWRRSARRCAVSQAFVAWVRVARRERARSSAASRRPAAHPSWWATSTAPEVEALLVTYRDAFGPAALDVLVELILDEAGERIRAIPAAA